jgi:outer membrane receptor protein involved in Fe transport
VLSPGFDLPGAPNLSITGFDQTGLTPPEGREDITGHLTDVASYSVGSHQFRFGGEFRRAQLKEFYHRHALGPSLSMDRKVRGRRTPPHPAQPPTRRAATSWLSPISWPVTPRAPASHWAILLVWSFVKDVNFFAQDAWQISRRLTVNYGLRWDYVGPLSDDQKDLSVFDPSLGGVVFQGGAISHVYPKDFKNFSPRVGFAYQPTGDSSLVVRAGFGVFFDRPNLNPFLDNRPSNGAPNGLEGNPAGPSPVDTHSGKHLSSSLASRSSRPEVRFAPPETAARRYTTSSPSIRNSALPTATATISTSKNHSVGRWSGRLAT